MNNFELQEKIRLKNIELGVTVDDRGKHYINGVPTQHSITSLLSYGERPVDWSKWVRNRDIGSIYHKILEYWHKGEEFKMFDKHNEQIGEFFKGYTPQVVENYIVLPQILLGGIVDYIGYFEDKLIMIDYKTSKQVSTKHRNQLRIYEQILKNVYDIEIDEMYVVLIDKGTGELTKSTLVKKWTKEKCTEYINKQLAKGTNDGK